MIPVLQPVLFSVLQPALNRAGRSGGGEVSASLRFQGTDNSALEDGFRFETSLTGSIPWVISGTIGPLTGTGLPIDQTYSGFAFNTLYYARIIAYNGSGDSTVSAQEVYTKPPLPPSGLVAVATGPGSIDLSWTKPAPEPLTGYRIYGRQAGGPIFTVVQEVAAGLAAATVSGLSDSTQYEFYLVAYNENIGGEDAETAFSNQAGATTLVETNPPTNLSASIDATGLILTINFSEPVVFGAGGNSGFALTATNGAVSPTYSGGSGGTTLTYGLSRVVYSPETVTLAYTQPGNGVEDAVGNDLATFSGHSVTNGSTQINYLLALDFEETGAPAGFALTSGTFNWDATDWPGGVPQGAQSLKITASNQIGYWTHTAASDVWAYCIVHIPSGSPVNMIPFRICDSSGNVVCSLTLTSAGALQMTVGGSTTNGTYSFDTTYHLWVHYTKGTGANALGEAFISTTATKPGSPAVSRVNGTSTADAARLKIDPANSHVMWVDKIRVSPTTIGSNPS